MERRGWFWAKVGLDLSKHQNVAKGSSLIKIPRANAMRAGVLLLVGNLVLVQGQVGQKVCFGGGRKRDWFWVKSGRVMDECWNGFGSCL